MARRGHQKNQKHLTTRCYTSVLTKYLFCSNNFANVTIPSIYNNDGPVFVFIFLQSNFKSNLDKFNEWTTSEISIKPPEQWRSNLWAIKALGGDVLLRVMESLCVWVLSHSSLMLNYLLHLGVSLSLLLH